MDISKLEKAIRKARDEAESVGLDRITAPFKETDMILYYLELLKPRVLTVDEAFGAEDPVYFEAYGNACFWTDIYLSSDLKHAVLHRFGSPDFKIPIAEQPYGYSWRCWSAKPSEEQKKAVKWDDERRT